MQISCKLRYMISLVAEHGDATVRRNIEGPRNSLRLRRISSAVGPGYSLQLTSEESNWNSIRLLDRFLSLSQLRETYPELISCGRPAYSNYHLFACLDPSTVDYSHPSVAGYYRFSTEQVDLEIRRCRTL
ncbi:hypothetical protein L1887_16401 [Cichorium endivia]|nr:hypothetical protein L1887_16401 [Cichorium endivia]